METELRTLKLFSRIILDKLYNNQYFPYKNYCKHYKKVSSRLRPMLFTPSNFFLKHTLSSSEGKFSVLTDVINFCGKVQIRKSRHYGDKQCKQMERFLAMAKEGDYFKN